MTRLTKSSSLGGAMPMARPSHSRAPLNQLAGAETLTSGLQVSGPLKTTMSPGLGSPNQYGTLLTSTRSPVQPVHPCSVCSIDPEGMKKACTKKVLTTSASTKAIRSRTGSSRRREPFSPAPALRRWLRESAPAVTAPSADALPSAENVPAGTARAGTAPAGGAPGGTAPEVGLSAGAPREVALAGCAPG